MLDLGSDVVVYVGISCERANLVIGVIAIGGAGYRWIGGSDTHLQSVQT